LLAGLEFGETLVVFSTQFRYVDVAEREGLSKLLGKKFRRSANVGQPFYFPRAPGHFEI